MGWFDTIAVAFTAVSVSLYAAAWITNSGHAALASAVDADIDFVSFENRFVSASVPAALREGAAALQPLERSALIAAEMKIRAAKELLARKLMSQDLRAGIVIDEPSAVEPKADEARVTEARVDEVKPIEAKPNEAKLDEAKLEEAKPALSGIPLPRARPAVVELAARPESPPVQDGTARQDDRTLMQKLSDLLPGRV